MTKLTVSKWGNSLAVRIPVELTQQANIKDGDQLEVRVGADGSLSLQKQKWDRKAFAASLTQRQKSEPITASVIEELRNQERY